LRERVEERIKRGEEEEQIHYRSKVWAQPDNLVFSIKTHFYLSNELKI